MAINASANSIASPLYQAFANSGPTWNLILPASLIWIVALTGVFLNSFVVVVTARSSSLRGSANFLMALICVCEVMHETGHTVFFVVAISGINFLDLFTANLFMIPMLFGTNMNMALLLSAAFDRLFAVAIPQRHKQICIQHKAAYLTGHTIACAIFGLYSLYYITLYSAQNSGIPTTACISEILSGEVGNHYFLLTTILNSLCVLCYILIWAIIRCKKGVTKETNTRLLRSLVIIMLVSIGGYFINLSIYQLLFMLATGNVFNPVRIWQIGFVAGVLLNVGAAANAPILFLNSSEYRKAFKPYLANLARFCKVSRSQQTATSVVQIRTSQHSKPDGGQSTGGAYY